MRVLLDTYVLIRAALSDLDRLGVETRSVVAAAQTERLVSSVSLTEIALKSAIGKLDINIQKLYETLDDLEATLIPYTELHVRRLFELPLLHREPFDRMLIATALTEDVPIVSIDRQFPNYRGLRVLR